MPFVEWLRRTFRREAAAGQLGPYGDAPSGDALLLDPYRAPTRCPALLPVPGYIPTGATAAVPVPGMIVPVITREDVLRQARSCLDIPWQHQGRTRLGVDCLGLIILVAKELGIRGADVDYTTYSREADPAELTRLCRHYLLPIPLAAMRPGDVVQLRDAISPCHLAFLANKGHPYSLIHAVTKWGKVVEHGFTRPWPHMVKAAYSLPGVAPWLD